MAYADFTLADVRSRLGIEILPAALFASPPAVAIPHWLSGALANAPQAVVLSEKARSEFLIAPILAAASALTERRMAVFSGTRMDADPEAGLVGVCDFILALGPSLVPLQTPLVALVAAKNQDIEAGLGQCIAEMVGARKINRDAGLPGDPLYGCVTTGEVWQFLRLVGPVAHYDTNRYYIPNVADILAILVAIHRECEAVYRT